MPFCGYCGKKLAYGENCDCPEALQNEPNKTAGMHDYVCKHCGANVPAGQTCTCPQAQFEARYVSSRPGQTGTAQAPQAGQQYTRPQQQQQQYGSWQQKQQQQYGSWQQNQQQQYGQYGQYRNTTSQQYNTPPVYPQYPYGDSPYSTPKKKNNGVLTVIAVILSVLTVTSMFSRVSRVLNSDTSKTRHKSGVVSTVKKEKTTKSTKPKSDTPAPATDGEFPTSYSLIDEELISPYIDYQGDFGSCFAFSWIGAFENRLFAMEKYEDLSEWAFYKSFKENYYNANRTNDIASMAHLQTAIVPEDDAPYPYDGDDYDVDHNIEKDSKYMLSDVYFLAGYDNDSDEDVARRAKEYLSKGYALTCSVYYDDGDFKYTNDYNGAWYVPENLYEKKKGINHAVLLIGWDDEYSRDNFLETPEHDGAWLVKNSWGETMGDDGFYWISYDDKMFRYSDLCAIDIADSSKADLFQSYWVYGWDFNYYNQKSNTSLDGEPTDQIYQACTYTAEKSMDITAASFFTTCDDIEYSVYISSNDNTSTDDEPNASGKQHTKGYHTVDLKEPVHVDKGEKYTVIVYMKSKEKGYLVAQDSEYSYDLVSAKTVKFGTCYVSSDGEEWSDVKSYCLSTAENDSCITPLCIGVYGKKN